MIGRGDFPENTFNGNTLQNEKRGLPNIANYEWEFFMNGELTTTPEYNGGKIGNCGIGILVDYGCEDIIIDGVDASYFNYMGIAVGFKATQDSGYNKNVTITNCNTHHNFDGGIHLINVDGYEVYNNKSHNNGHPNFKINDYEIDPGYGIALRGARMLPKNGSIHHNKCYNNNRKGIDVHSGEDWEVHSNKVADCVMSGISVTKSNVGMSILRGSVHNNNIVNCGVMESIGGFGQGMFLACDDLLTVKNNHLYRCGINNANVRSAGITTLEGDMVIEDNVLIDCGITNDINCKSNYAKIKGNIIKDSYNTNDTKISIYAYTDDTTNSYIEVDNNYIKISKGRGMGFQKFADGKARGNQIIAPTQIAPVSDNDLRANIDFSSDNNIKTTASKIEATKGLAITNSYRFTVKINANGTIEHNGNPKLISSVTDNVNGFRINYAFELKDPGVIPISSNSTTGIDVVNLYVRENGRNYATIALGTTANTAGVAASTIGKPLSYDITIVYS